MSTQTNPQTKPPQSPLVDAALARTLPGISPAGLLEAIENPNVIEGAARGDLYVQLGILRQLSAAHTFTVSHRLQYATLLAKLGKVMGADAVDGNATQAPNVNIILGQMDEPRKPGRPALTVVEASAHASESIDALPDFSDLGAF